LEWEISNRALADAVVPLVLQWDFGEKPQKK
jgi:hypothetical protein